jgi:ABC-2 type transport system ATP-binding protein
VLILDEPTTGMDPVATRDFRALVRELRADGKTVLITTHDMAEAEQMCDRVSLIDHGRLLFTESPQGIGPTAHRRRRSPVRQHGRGAVAELREVPGVVAVEPGDGGTAGSCTRPGTWWDWS